MNSPIIIQTGQMPQGRKFMPEIFSGSLPRLIFVVLTLIILGELIWGVWFVMRPVGPVTSGAKRAGSLVIPEPPKAKLTLSADKQEVKKGDEFSVVVKLTTNNRTMSGADLVINYDPKVLSFNKDSFVRGPIFTNYVGQSIDNKKGVFRVSGIMDLSNKDKVAKDGIFATLKFKAQNKGSSPISIEYRQGGANESNVIDSKLYKDILDSVGNLVVKIN